MTEPKGQFKSKYEIAERLAALVSEKGGRAYFVGGCVRDSLMGRVSMDVDIEVHGLEPRILKDILGEIGEPLTYGSSFGIYSLKGCDIDIAMPRKERATGRGHRDFEVDVDPYIGTEGAALRRDFTINALMQDVLDGEIIDHFGGRDDLKKGIVRHINDSGFGEDPLRVLRAAGFASRFGFEIAPETVEICRGMDISVLSKERVEKEMEKALMMSPKPSVFFEKLRKMDQLGYWFPELQDLIGVEQDPLYHPEGDVWTHTMEVIDRGADLRDKADRPYEFMLLCLTHDLGKPLTTAFEKGRIHSYGHETEGVPVAEAFLNRITGNRSVRDYVTGMIPLHMKPNVVAYNQSALKTTNRMFYEAASPNDLILFSLADRPVMAGDFKFSGDERFLRERLKEYEEIMERPYVKGSDLIEAGIAPGPELRELLEYSTKLRLAGIPKESALKQTLAYAGKRKK